MSSDWVEAKSSPTVLDGAFNAHDYGAFMNNNGASERVLNRYGFVAGYSGEWQQKVTQDYLEERVFQFGAASGAGYWYADLHLENTTSKYYKRDIPTLAGVTSFGVELDFAGGDHEYVVEFMKGSLMFVVHMYSYDTDLSNRTLSIAQTEYDLAPAATQNVASVTTTNVPPLISLAIVGLFVLIGTVVFALARTSRRRFLATPTGGFQMSEDGTSWWDGARWHDARMKIPPTAWRSPDGVYWWDGHSWRRVGT